jgi:hypothetical protein
MADDTGRGLAGKRKRATTMTGVRLARVVRSPEAALAAGSGGARGDGAVVIEVGGARVTVGRGADLQTIVMVLALLRGGGR